MNKFYFISFALLTLWTGQIRAQIQIQPSELAFSLIVTDSIKAKQFFGQCLNLPFVGYGNIQAAKMLLYKSGNATVKVRIYQQNPPIRNTEILAQNGIRFITIPVNNFNDVISNLQNNSFTVSSISTLNNVRTAMVKDGDNNIYELIDAPTAPTRKLEIGIIVDDSSSILPFYQSYLGLPAAPAITGPNPLSNTQEYRFYANQTVLRIYAPAGTRPTYNEGIADACGYRYITFTLVQNTDIIYQNLISNNIGVLKPLAPNPSNPNIYVCMFHGPGGSTHEFVGPVSAGYNSVLFQPVFEHNRSIGQATVLFDMNNDGLLDFASAHKEKYYIIKNNGNGDFTEYGEYNTNQINGFGSYDLNNDGKLDFTQAQTASPTNLGLPDNMMNNGNNTFTGINSGNESFGATRNVVYGDLNNDGYPESYHGASAFGNRYEANQLHKGLPNGQFGPDIMDSVLPGVFYENVVHPTLGNQYRSALQSKGGIMRDFDKDGKADIVNAVYIDLGFQPDTFAYNYVLNQKRGLFLFKNTSTSSTISLQDVSNQALGNDAVGNTYNFWNAYAPVALDYDRDGDYDIIAGGLLLGANNNNVSTDIIRLYENVSTPGNLLFENKTNEAGLSQINNLNYNTKRQVSLAAGIPIDYDNDGWVDIMFVNRKDVTSTFAPNVFVYKNNGNKTFTLIPLSQHGIGGQGGGRDINVGDLNNDGKQDVIVSDGTGGGYDGSDKTIVYQNGVINSNKWVQLDIRKTLGGSWAFDYTVKVYQSGTTNLIAMDDVRTDFSYRSKRYPILHFGLGNTTAIDVVISKGNETYQAMNLQVNQVHQIILSNLLSINENLIELDKLIIYPNPANTLINVNCKNGYKIYSTTGQLVLENSQPTTQINISHLQTGFYILKTDNKIGRFIKTE